VNPKGAEDEGRIGPEARLPPSTHIRKDVPYGHLGARTPRQFVKVSRSSIAKELDHR